ncbi:phosphomannomutase [Mesobaculum littorinae]|uniref:Phosphomannomutase n=1 Tax=Mesobaculum littorinae TaxID=2486419 RepID=A0A438AFY0_9RHOB|nr:phosphomannomutase [Mesobaculum littorinae]RVV97611.1 phosphomannomutase [Mesobaculum littorinae]
MTAEAPKFGTSGLRGLVTALTPACVGAYARAFAAACPTGGAVHLGWDLRPSSGAIADAVGAALTAAGRDVVRHGVLPTPALALAAGQAGQAAIMITGSHIPADRNGLKFYTPHGEITKADEAAILAHLGSPATGGAAGGATGCAAGRVREAGQDATDAYVARYTRAFGPEALAGLRIGVYQHSSAARDILVTVSRALGATAVPLARSETFVAVDTEAVDPATRTRLAGWCRDLNLDAVISADGDADRPLVTDATGRVVPGDVLGPLTARLLGADTVCTPVSSNTLVTQLADIGECHLTRIGSPFVIAAMDAALARAPDARVVGYEANGGFLLGFAAQGPAGALPPLLTRDCLLPILAPLALARRAGQGLAGLVATLPPVFTAADRLTGIAPEVSAPFLATLQGDHGARAAFLADLGLEAGLDLTDGLRLHLQGGEIVHLRPSGNAPEFRCYTEAASPERANDLLAACLDTLRARL